jgi:hypothetical protein
MPHPTKAERERRRLEETAYHEAGHAVAAIVLRRGFSHVTIEPRDDSLGHVKPNKHPESFRPDISDDARDAPRIEREVLMLLAGIAAEKHLRGRRNYRGASQDLRMAVDVAGYLFSRRTLEKYLEYMIERAEDFISMPFHWLQVEALATALLERRTLSARAARVVCRSALADPTRLDELRRKQFELIDAQDRQESAALETAE